MALHYKKDGTLDMRYSSSRAAVAAASPSSSSYATSSSRSSSRGAGAGGQQPSSSASSSRTCIGSGYTSRAAPLAATASASASGLHYKRDGTLDMRYASSRAAAAAPKGSTTVPPPAPSSTRPPSMTNSSPTSSSSASAASQLHYKKDGSLDMRYRSSRAEQLRHTRGTAAGAAPAVRTAATTNVRFKKDGTPDMRYKSSREQAAIVNTARSAGSSSSRSTSATSASASTTASAAANATSPLHYKKDGTLDMRYKSSKNQTSNASTNAASAASDTSAQLHYKKDGTLDGTLDMRYRSSKEIAGRMNKMALSSTNPCAGVPATIPVTKAGLPDVRTKRAKEWVCHQAQQWEDGDPLPQWMPRLKDGSPDTSKSVTRAFFGNTRPPPEPRREEYYSARLADELFQEMMERQLSEVVPFLREPPQLEDTTALRQAFETLYESQAPMERDSSRSPASHQPPSLQPYVMPSHVKQLDFVKDLVIDEEEEPLGQGSFGVVVRGMWNEEIVAIKKLHTAMLTKRERKMFITEATVLGLLGDHPHIVQLYGYTLNPVAIVMEYIPNGSLSYLLHYCEDAEIEAKVTDGRVKQNLLLGIAYGMAQLHACGITHGDLKPQNVLVSEDFQAKIADFGLSTFRAKTSSLMSSHQLSQTSNGDEDALEGAACGTAAYMAPELLDAQVIANEKTDVYSFGILMNELLQEEEPYYQHLRQFVGKGPYAASLAAKNGLRPIVHDARVTPALKGLIERCWHADPSERPTFTEIGYALASCDGVPSSMEWVLSSS